MSKIDGARTFLQDIGMPKAQQGDLCCYSLLAMAGITADTEWADASNNWIRIHDIMQFIRLDLCQYSRHKNSNFYAVFLKASSSC